MSDDNGRTRKDSLIGAAILAVAACVGIYSGLKNLHTPSGLGQAWTYDLASAAATDPNLIAWTQVATIPTGMDEPRGIAVDSNDNLFIVGDKLLRVLNAAGGEFRRESLPEPPRCVACNSSGWAAIGFQKQVRMYSLESGFDWYSWGHDVTIKLDDRSIITSLAFGSGLFIADAGNRTVWRYINDGNLRDPRASRIGLKDANRNIEGFVIPSPHFDIAMGKDTLLRVVNPGNHRIEAYTEGGDMEFAWGTFDTAPAGFCGCCNPTDIAILPDGSFVTSEKGLPRVKIYDANGVFKSIVAGSEAFKEDVQGLDLAAGNDGRIYVLDPSIKAVRVFAKKPAAGSATRPQKEIGK